MCSLTWAWLRSAIAEIPKAQEDNGKPLFGGFVRLDPKVGQAQMLFDIEVIHLDGPALVRDAQDLLCRQREGGAQENTSGVCPEDAVCWWDTDVKRQMGEPPLAWSYQVRALSSVCSGQLHALRPLVPERVGPLGELLVVQLPLGLDRPYHLPALTAAEFEQAIGSIPTVEEYVDLEARGPPRLSLRQHRLSERCFCSYESATAAQEPDRA